MKKPARQTILLFLVAALALVSCPGGLAGPEPPAKETVIEKLEEVKREEIDAINQQNLRIYLGSLISEWVQSNQIFFNIGLVALLVALGALLVFLVFRLVAGKRLGRRLPDQADDVSESPDFTPRELIRLERAGEYSTAVLFLHRGSVLRLLEEKALTSSNLTNNSVASRIADAKRRQAFARIAALAERILFDRYEAAAADYRLCREAFSRYFASRSPA